MRTVLQYLGVRKDREVKEMEMKMLTRKFRRLRWTKRAKRNKINTVLEYLGRKG